MWRGGLRSGLSVPAPFGWRCLTSRTITPFPHPSHRTGHAELPHPALGQDTHLRTRKVTYRPPAHRPRPCDPDVRRPSVLQITASATTWANIRSPERTPGSFFASACGAFRGCRTYQEFPRVAPISRAPPLPAPVLNQGPFPPPALPGFPGTTGLSATPQRPACPSRASGWSSSNHAMGLPVLRASPLCTCCRHYPGTAPGCISRSLRQTYQPSPQWRAGRPVQRPFRGLLSVHSRYGLHTRWII